MMNATIRIELNNLDKAKVEVEALLVYINELAKTYPTTFKNEPKDEEVEVEEKKPAPKKRVGKIKRAEGTVEKGSEETPEPKDEPAITLQELTALGKKVVAAGKRDEAKALIAEYSPRGTLSATPKDKYDELATKLGELLDA